MHHLKETIGNTTDLFGIVDPDPHPGIPSTKSRTDRAEYDLHVLGQVRLREKRWAVYVARAVNRFQKW